SNLYIARMDSPTSITGKAVMLSRPEFDWETVRYRVNEGPAALIRHGRVFIAYSASGTGPEYCVGLLWADENADLLDPASWRKSPEPVFQGSEKHRVYGPAHSTSTTTPYGAAVRLWYHARSDTELEGGTLRDPDRHAPVQSLHWAADGMPVFGGPVPDSFPEC